MLRKFRVSNFKSFGENFELDFTKPKGYEFNQECVKNGCINNAIIYGKNGVGKSNLALAIFDILTHLTDRSLNPSLYSNYLNIFKTHIDEIEGASASNNVMCAYFYYEFEFNSKILTYSYTKTDYRTLWFENLKIDGDDFAWIDRENSGNDAIFSFIGGENLEISLSNKEISILKYIKNNSNLELNDTNVAFFNLFKFVEKMSVFRSVENIFQQRNDGLKTVLKSIAEKGNVKDFEKFLNEAGIECHLSDYKLFDERTVVFDFGLDNSIPYEAKYLRPFNEIASTGTLAMTQFYYWYQNIKENNRISFVFIDEFDAFYHHELSKLIVKKLKESGVQFILTTHNTSIMTNDLLRPDCYFVMTKDHIRSLADSTEKELREAHNLEKMYKAKAFNE